MCEYACPLCCNTLDADEKRVSFCSCDYALCRFCYQRLLDRATEDNSAKCPNCRTPYEASSVRARDDGRNPGVGESAKSKEAKKCISNGKLVDLMDVRVIQRNLVYAVGLAPEMCSEQVLRSPEYFGQHGKIKKVTVNRSNPSSSAKHPQAGAAYVVFFTEEDAWKCIQSIDGRTMHGKQVRACYGTTKYCHAYLKGVTCTNPDCQYLHDQAPEVDTVTKEDMSSQSSRKDILHLVHPGGTVRGQPSPRFNSPRFPSPRLKPYPPPRSAGPSPRSPRSSNRTPRNSSLPPAPIPPAWASSAPKDPVIDPSPRSARSATECSDTSQHGTISTTSPAAWPSLEVAAGRTDPAECASSAPAVYSAPQLVRRPSTKDVVVGSVGTGGDVHEGKEDDQAQAPRMPPHVGQCDGAAAPQVEYALSTRCSNVSPAGEVDENDDSILPNPEALQKLVEDVCGGDGCNSEDLIVDPSMWARSAVSHSLSLRADTVKGYTARSLPGASEGELSPNREGVLYGGSCAISAPSAATSEAGDSLPPHSAREPRMQSDMVFSDSAPPPPPPRTACDVPPANGKVGMLPSQASFDSVFRSTPTQLVDGAQPGIHRPHSFAPPPPPPPHHSTPRSSGVSPAQMDTLASAMYDLLASTANIIPPPGPMNGSFKPPPPAPSEDSVGAMNAQLSAAMANGAPQAQQHYNHERSAPTSHYSSHPHATPNPPSASHDELLHKMTLLQRLCSQQQNPQPQQQPNPEMPQQFDVELLQQLLWQQISQTQQQQHHQHHQQQQQQGPHQQQRPVTLNSAPRGMGLAGDSTPHYAAYTRPPPPPRTLAGPHHASYVNGNNLSYPSRRMSLTPTGVVHPQAPAQNGMHAQYHQQEQLYPATSTYAAPPGYGRPSMYTHASQAPSGRAPGLRMPLDQRGCAPQYASSNDWEHSRAIHAKMASLGLSAPAGSRVSQQGGGYQAPPSWSQSGYQH